MRRVALRLFDEAAPLDPGTASFDPARIVRARRNLLGTLEGYGEAGRRMCEALGLPERESAKKAGKRGKAKEPA